MKPTDFQASIDSEFERLLLQMMEKDPLRRPATPAKLLNELERIGRFHNLEADWNAWS